MQTIVKGGLLSEAIFYSPFLTSSGGQTWTADLTIMSRALLPTELRRHKTYFSLWALFRDWTGDLFLTMEVLYQLS